MSLIVRSNVKKLHDKGITGKGVKIAVWDTRRNDTCHNHPDMVEEIVKQVAPECETKIFVFNTVDKGIADILSWGADIANISMIGIDVDLTHTFSSNKEKYEEFFNKCYVVASSGNSGVEEYNYPASTEKWKDKCLAVGACYPLGDKVVMKGYSTFNNRVDIANYSGIVLKDGSRFEGTSCSAPYTSGEVALFYQMFMNLNGRKPTIKETNDYIFSICEDVGIEGIDSFSGYGVPKMELLKEKPKMKIELYIDKPHYTVNGETKIFTGLRDGKIVYTPPTLIDGRTYIPLRGVLEELGYTVEWEQSTKKITITKG